MVFTSCGSTKILTKPHDPDASIIFLSRTSLDRIDLVLENTETHQQYTSSKFKSIKRGNIIFYNIPSGTYKVVRVELRLQVGNSIASFVNYSDELSEYFGPIVIEPASKYLLGVYKGYCKGIPITTVRDHIKFEYVQPGSINNSGIVDEIREAVSNSDWKDGEFIILCPAKYNEVFDFY